MAKLDVNVCGVQFKNPIIAASGTFGFGGEFEHFFPMKNLGGLATKAITPTPREGNPTPRIAEVRGGILNAVGLQNPGVEVFTKGLLPWLLKKETNIIVNIAASTIDEYVALAARFNDTGVHMIELNISCPNVKEGGVQFGIYPEAVKEITRAVKDQCPKVPLMVKLTPNCADIAKNAVAAQDGGADCISLINTITGMAIDPISRKPILANVTGGFSGPALKSIALRMVYQAYKAVTIPIIGMGGITTGTDVAEFMICGASAVQVGTANFTNPNACMNILAQLEEFLQKNNIDDVNSLVGTLKA